MRLLEPCHSSHCEEHLGEPQWTERHKNPLIGGRVKEAGVIKHGKMVTQGQIFWKAVMERKDSCCVCVHAFVCLDTTDIASKRVEN